jgi:hypothetical protein
MTEISHEHCSELLRPFLRDDLDPATAASVRSHLDGCADCAHERDALVVLLEAEDDRLSPLESARLRTLVRAAVTPASQDVISVPPARSRTYRFAQALGAAALILGGAVFAYTAVTGNLSGDDAGQATSGAIGDQATARIVKGLPVRVPGAAPRAAALEQADNARRKDTAGQTSGGGGGADAEQFFAPEVGAADQAKARRRPKPVYAIDVPPLTELDLTSVGRYGTALLSFTRNYRASDAEELQIEFLRLLANATGDDTRSDQVTQCGMTVLARPYPTLPAIAFYAERDDDEVLVLAFAWADDPDGRLDRFMVWSWRDGDCDSVPDYRSGAIKT